MMYRGVPETLALGFLDVSWRNALIRQVEQGFSSFFAKFLAQNEEKPLAHLALNPFLHHGTSKTSFGYSRSVTTFAMGRTCFEVVRKLLKVANPHKLTFAKKFYHYYMY